MVARSLVTPGVAYVAPMAAFLLLLTAGPYLGLGVYEYPLRVAILSAVLWGCSRQVIDLRAPSWPGSAVLGAAVFVIWVGPDWLWPAWRSHWVFQNSITGVVKTSLPPGYESSSLVLVCRALRAVVLVPIIEELFWRGWLMRWLIDSDVEKVPLGAYARASFWITAALFAGEHGAFWEVGLAAGILYNWWMLHTRSLGDCIVAHAVTNGLLSAYVVLAGKWEYW